MFLAVQGAELAARTLYTSPLSSARDSQTLSSARDFQTPSSARANRHNGLCQYHPTSYKVTDLGLSLVIFSFNNNNNLHLGVFHPKVAFTTPRHIKAERGCCREAPCREAFEVMLTIF